MVILTQYITTCRSNVYVNLIILGTCRAGSWGGGGGGTGGGSMACGCCHFFQDTTQKQFSFGVLLSALNLKVLKATLTLSYEGTLSLYSSIIFGISNTPVTGA